MRSFNWLNLIKAFREFPTISSDEGQVSGVKDEDETGSQLCELCEITVNNYPSCLPCLFCLSQYLLGNQVDTTVMTYGL